MEKIRRVRYTQWIGCRAHNRGAEQRICRNNYNGWRPSFDESNDTLLEISPRSISTGKFEVLFTEITADIPVLSVTCIGCWKVFSWGKKPSRTRFEVMPDTLDPDNRRDVHGVIFHSETLIVDVCFCSVYFFLSYFLRISKMFENTTFSATKVSNFSSLFRRFFKTVTAALKLVFYRVIEPNSKTCQ